MRPCSALIAVLYRRLRCAHCRRRGPTSLPMRVAGLGGDSFADKEKAIVALGKLGDPRAVPILQALGDDRLRTRAGRPRRRRSTRRRHDQADRRGDRRRSSPDVAPGQPRPDHRQQPAARRDRGGARRADPVQHRPRDAARRGAGRAEAPLGRRRDIARKGASPPSRTPRSGRRCSGASAAAQLVRRQQGRTARGDRARSAPPPTRRSRTCSTSSATAPDLDPELRKAADAALASIDRRLRLTGLAANLFQGHQPRQRPAARRDRPRHHLWRDGRHQHGAWRDDHARRLCRLCRASSCFAPSCRRAGSTPI